MIQQRPRLFSEPPSIRLEGQRQSEVAGMVDAAATRRKRHSPSSRGPKRVLHGRGRNRKKRLGKRAPLGEREPDALPSSARNYPSRRSPTWSRGFESAPFSSTFRPSPASLFARGCALRARVGRGVGEPRPPCRSRRRSVLDARGSCSATPDGRGEQPRVGSPPWRAPSRNASPDTRCEQLSRAARRPVGFRE